MRSRPRRARGWCLAAALSAIVVAGGADAAPRPRIDIAAAPLAAALDDLARQTGVSVGTSGALPDVTARPVHGARSAQAALDRLLAGTGLVAVRAGERIFRIEPAPIFRARTRPAAVPAPAPAPAASPPEASSQIVVTGTKRALAAFDVPFGISVVSLGPGLAANALPGTAAALATVSEVTLTNQGPGRDRLFIRGVADSPFNGPSQTTVSQFLDDARISFSAPDPDLRLVDVARVEVLAGPQGTLYGTGSLGGIYRIVPVKPDAARLSGDAAVEAAAVAHGGTGLSGDAVLNVPIVDDRLAVRAVGYRALDAGWITDTGRALTEINRVETRGGRIALRWMPSAAWTFDASGAFQSIAARDSQYAAGPGALTRATRIAEPHDSRFAMGSFALHGRLGRATLDTTTAFVRLNSATRYDASVGTVTRAFDERRSLDMITHETRLADAAARWPWLVGIGLLSTESDLGGAFRTGAARMPVTNNRQNVFDLALFGETTVPFTRKLGLTVGGRVFQTTTHARELGDETEAPVTERTRHLSATPSVALLWRAAPRTRVYARFASAIRPGGLSPANGGDEPRAYEDDDLESIEAGARHTSPSGALALDLSVFRQRWRGVQADLLGRDGIVTTANVGEALNAGVTLAATLRKAGWSLEARATAQHPRLTHPAAIVAGTRHASLPSVPDVTANLMATRAFDLGPVHARVEATARYVGRSRLTFEPGLERAMGDYALIDLGLVLNRGGWRVAARAANVIDNRANSFAFGNPFSVRNLAQRTPVQPRTVSIDFGHAF